MWATSPTSMSSPRLVGKAKCLQCTTNRPPLTDHKLSWSSEESAQYSPLAKRSSHWEEPAWRPRRLGWPGCHKISRVVKLSASPDTYCFICTDLCWHAGAKLRKKTLQMLWRVRNRSLTAEIVKKNLVLVTKTSTRSNQPERQAHPAPWSLPCTTCCFSPLGCSLHSPSPPRGKILLEDSPSDDLL